MVVQREAIPESEFGQALFIKFLQETCGPSVQRESPARQYLRYEGLVVTHPGQQQDQAEDSVEHLTRRRGQLTRSKIEDQSLFESRAVAVTVAEREGRSRRIVVVAFKTELAIHRA